MTTSLTGPATPRKPLRLWPGVVAVVLLWLARLVLPIVMPDAPAYGILAGLFGGLVVLVWWLFFSRAPWSERVGAIVLTVVTLFATTRIVHVSIRTGMQGMLLPVYAIFVLSPAFDAASSQKREHPAREQNGRDHRRAPEAV